MAARFTILAAVSAIVVAATPASPASAAYSHGAPEFTFPVGGTCTEVTDMDVLEPEDLLYVACRNGEHAVIKRFKFNGEPAPFSGSAPYINGNTITEDPQSEANGAFKTPFFDTPQVAVDSSASPNHGKLFVTSIPNVDIFLPSGIESGSIVQPFGSSNGALDIGPDGFIYLNSDSPGGRISKYTPTLNETKRLYTFTGNFHGSFLLSVDSVGALWFVRSGPLTKYEPDQFTEELEPHFGTPLEDFIRYKATPSSSGPEPAPTQVTAIDVDLAHHNDVYVDTGTEIETYSEGSASERSYPNAPAFGSLTGSQALAVTADQHVFAGTGTEIARFGRGEVLPDVHTFAAKATEVGHTDATLHAKVELNAGEGGTPIKACKFEYGIDTSYGSVANCEPETSFGSDREVSAHLTSLTEGATYHFRVMAENEKGKNTGIDRTFTPPFVLGVNTLPATEVETGSATLNASLNPDGTATEYKFEYGLTETYGLETPFSLAGSGPASIEVHKALTSLPRGTLFHYRVVAKNLKGTTVGLDGTFRTAAPPDVSGVRASEVAEASATLSANINPGGYETKYFFEYGTSPAYGLKAPAALTSVGAGTEPVDVSQQIEGLKPGVTYHFRVFAENKWGVTESSDTTFDFTPPACPNSHVRQQSASSYLPDCRAYELVSPDSVGAAILVPAKFAMDRNKGKESEVNGAYDEGQYGTYPPENQGFATSPSRFTFYSAASTIEGSHSPLGTVDMYMATRTSHGWVTKVPGLQNNEAYETARKTCSESMNLCADHSETNSAGFKQESSPYIFSADGEKQGRLPTNVGIVPGGTHFHGGQRLSGDFSHFAFSSSDFQSVADGNAPGVIFAPGGLTAGLGSAYDNDIAKRTVKIISKWPGGAPIMLEGEKALNQRGFDFPGMSPDGSHVLMQTPATPGGWFGNVHLFMSIDEGAVTYPIPDAEPGHSKTVKFIGMTRNGSKVFFTSEERLTSDDNDNSTDLYMWSENGGTPTLTRISQGNGNGDTNACSASWIAGCGVQPLTPEYARPNQNSMVSFPGMDDLIAEESGDVYFYSPEQLDAAHPGVPGQRNLYVYRHGAVQLVATFEAETEVRRDQISPDGAHAAFLTKSQLTSYDNDGFEEVYTYEPDTRKLVCASCKPSGLPPRANVVVSFNGRFMSDDGRTFFSTPDSLVPRDHNGDIIDTYEYVDGRPQLISSGLGSKDFTGGGEVASILFVPEHIGLEAVSRSGGDVYFSTFETLVENDHNGEFVKFYDARTNGGFPQDPALAPCAAADECHGADSSAPTAPVVGSSANLGRGGNVSGEGSKKHKKHPKKHKKKHRKHGKTQRSGR